MTAADELVINIVRSETTDREGRSHNTSGGHDFEVHLPSRYGGDPPAAITPADAFLSGISSCAVLLIESLARDDGRQVAVTAEVEGHRRVDDTSWFTAIDVRITLDGCDADTASVLVEGFKTKCPLYRTVEAATSITTTWELASD